MTKYQELMAEKKAAARVKAQRPGVDNRSEDVKQYAEKRSIEKDALKEAAREAFRLHKADGGGDYTKVNRGR